MDILGPIGGWQNGLLDFDLNKLTLQDYRQMLNHYQVNSSLSVLSFMLHQSSWSIECDNKKIRDLCTDVLQQTWTQLNRSMSQAHWAGYSPNILQWENDDAGKRVILTKIKDLYPEEATVHWKEVDGWSPPGSNHKPRLKVYDGIKQIGSPYPIPVANSFWYPLLMENGNYYGRKLLKASFTSYFYSILVHMFSNRYFERYGEPTPVGRAPLEDTVDVRDTNGDLKQISAREYMLQMIMSLRHRGAVVLPSDKTAVPGTTTSDFDYTLSYLESQMRGADFERYLQRLDEEISLGLFTPVLLFQTSDVGSYNLGTGHYQIYLHMLNAINADRAQYINKYILAPLTRLNWKSGPLPRIRFQKMDNTNADLVKTILQALIGKDKVKFDLDQLGEMAGLSVSEVRETVQQPNPNPQPDNAQQDPNANDTGSPVDTAKKVQQAREGIITRVTGQVTNAFSRGQFGPDFKLQMGHKNNLQGALVTGGLEDGASRVDRMFARLDAWSRDISEAGMDVVASPEAYMGYFTRALDSELEGLL